MTTTEHFDRIARVLICWGGSDAPALESLTALREQIAEMERERCQHDEASISAMAADYQEQIAVLTAKLEAAEEISEELISFTCAEIGIYDGEDPDSALSCIRGEFVAYSKVMWAIAGILNSGSARPDDVEAAVRQQIATLTAERDTWEKRARSLCDERAALTGAAMKTGLVVSCGKDGHRITHEPELALQIALTRAQDADERIATLESARDAAVERVGVLEGALRAVLVMWDRGPCPKKLDDALSWRENDEKARQMADAALSTVAPKPQSALPTAPTPCPHEWVERDSDIGGDRTDVTCRKCAVPGERNDITGNVFFPAT